MQYGAYIYLEHRREVQDPGGCTHAESSMLSLAEVWGRGMVAACDVAPGDELRSVWLDGAATGRARVEAVEPVSFVQGLFCPLTRDGPLPANRLGCSRSGSIYSRLWSQILRIVPVAEKK